MANCIIISGGTWSPDNWCKVKRSLGPYRLASALEDAGFSTFVLDYIENFTTDEIIHVLNKHIDHETLWVGFSSTFFWGKQDDMYYTDISEVHKVIHFIKSKNVKVIYGGAKTPYFNNVDNDIDYYVTGNADVSIVNVTNFIAGKEDLLHIDDKTIDSFKYPEPDVKNIPTRWWKHKDILPNEALPIELARGCIFKCKFCNFQLTGKKKGTYLRDSSQVRDEMIRTWEEHGTESFYITDDTFNDDNDKLDELHKVFTSLPFKPKFASYLRVDLLHRYPHQAKLLEEMGLIGTYMGIETTNPDSARAIGKGLHPDKVKDRLYWLKEQWGDNVNIEAGFILGLPYDTLGYFNELLGWTLQYDNPIDTVHFFPLMLFHHKEERLKRYSSEFALNPDVYGYELIDEGICTWSLPSQKLNYNMCLDLSNNFNVLRRPMNKMSGFYMITGLNTGITLEDMRNLTQNQIEVKYNIPLLNSEKIENYKRMVL